MFNIRTIFFNVFAKAFGYFTVTLEKVFTCHALLAWGTARRNDVFGTSKRLRCISGGSNLGTVKTALAHLLCHTFGWEHVIKANV